MYRIGELARRTGTSVDLLRAWERRYGLLRPERTEGGFRLYGDEDAARVERMRTGLSHGLAAAEAARAALVPLERSEELLPALLAFDGERANDLLDKLFSRLSVEGVLRESIQPALREIGDRWARGEVSVAQEHFAANLLRGRLLALASRWDQGVGPRALLACAPGDCTTSRSSCSALRCGNGGGGSSFSAPTRRWRSSRPRRPQSAPISSCSRARASASLRRSRSSPRSRQVLAWRLRVAGRCVDVPALRLEGDAVELAASLDATVIRA